MSELIAPQKRIPKQLQTPLAFAYGFDYGDLQDNRSGFISHWQKKRLRWYVLSYTFSIVMWISILTAIPLIIASLLVGSRSIAGFANFWFISIVMIFGAFWFWKLWSVTIDMRRGQVQTLTGNIRHYRRERRSRQATTTDVLEPAIFDHYIVLGREKFSVSQEQMEAFDYGMAYRVFVSPLSRQILSAEPVINNNDNHSEDNATIEDSDDIWGADEILAQARKQKTRLDYQEKNKPSD